MAYKFVKACRTCQVIESEGGTHDSPLYKRIQENQLHGKRKPLKDVALAYPQLNYLALINHSKKHQNVTELRRVRSDVKESERRAIGKARAKVHHTESRTDLVGWLQDKVDSGEVKPTLSGLVALLKQEADVEAKQTDQALEYAKLFGAYVGNPLPPPSKVIEGETVES